MSGDNAIVLRPPKPYPRYGRLVRIALERQAAQAGEISVACSLGVEPGMPIEPKVLADGSLGYFVRTGREDDCFAAAIATVLQVPIGQVPDPRIDERLAAGEAAAEIDRSAQRELARWLTRRGLRMAVHRSVPASRRRWIGVVPMPGDFMNHCLVMSRETVLFDPATAAEGVRIFGLEDVRQALSFQSTTKRS